MQELKRFQIRSGRSVEVLMVKRLVDKFRKEVKAPGMGDFQGPYTYKNYELYLYGKSLANFLKKLIICFFRTTKKAFIIKRWKSNSTDESKFKTLFKSSIF